MDSKVRDSGWLLFVAVCSCLVFVLLGGRFARRARHLFVPETVTVSLPKDSSFLTFTRIGRHPYASEYSRSVSCRSETKGGVQHKLSLNTGWPTYVNVYWIEEEERQLVRLQDFGHEYLFDMQKDTLYIVRHFNGRTFAGKMTTDKPSITGGGPPGDPSAAKIYVDGVLAEPIESITTRWEGRYIGVISGATNQLTFWPSTEKAERAIGKLTERAATYLDKAIRREFESSGGADKRNSSDF